MLERAMRMFDGSFRSQALPAGATVGWVAVEAHPDITAAARSALEQADVAVRPISLPSFKAAFAAGLTIISAENWAAYSHLMTCESLGSDVRTRLLASRAISAADVEAAESVRRAFRAQVDAALAEVDALALPTLPDFPLTIAAAADAAAALQVTSFVRPFNLSGHPALSIALAAANGLPAGLQLVGRLHEDEALCALARLVADRL
jgi:amidase